MGAALALAALSASCGQEIPRGGVAAPPPAGARVVRRVDPTELIPSDLDLVVRVDMARMKSGLGPEATGQLLERALAAPGEELLREALSRAEVVWIAMRLADVSSGDRLLIAEGRMAGLDPDPEHWRPARSANSEVSLYDRIGEVPRAGTARLVAMRERVIGFVSPVELDSVARVLRDGPDEKRGDPSADGVISVDIRGRRLPPAAELRFPSIAAIIAGIDRVRASLVFVDTGAKLEARIECADAGAAERAQRFLTVMRDGVSDPAYRVVLGSARIEQTGAFVEVRWEVPAPVVLGLVSRLDPEPPPKPP